MREIETKCGHVSRSPDHHTVVYEDVAYPYNPEWSLQRRDAGLFCSDECLRDYLHDKLLTLEAERRHAEAEAAF